MVRVDGEGGWWGWVVRVDGEGGWVVVGDGGW